MSTYAQNRYIVGLDGLRALAVIAVVAYHFFPSVLPGGFIGVDVFFVISGFLITTLLLDEKNKTGRISLKGFWVRRVRRLFPALLTLICVISAVAFFVGGDILVGIGRQILGALTFSSNWLEVGAGTDYFDSTGLRLFTNLWSLAVEEQFYVVWPLIVGAVTSLPLLRRSAQWGMWLCLVFAAGSGVLMAYMYTESSLTRLYYGTDTHLFGLMLGAATAFWLNARNTAPVLKPWSLRKKKVVRRLGIAAFVGLLAAIIRLSDASPVTYRGGLAGASILTVIVMIATISSRGLLQKIFSLRPVSWIGVRSYGIYLWHWPLFVCAHYILPASFALWAVSGISAVATFILAELSFRFVETPIRREGLNAYISKSVSRRAKVINGVFVKWKHRPHPALLGSLVVLVLAGAAVWNAPPKTLAELRIEEGQKAIREAEQNAASQPKMPEPPPVEPATSLPPKPKPVTIDGSYITVIGDSVTLASARALQERFPGILINAEVSRSLRSGGFPVIDSLAITGQLRPVVVVALGTNGYYGDGNLEKLIAQLSDRKVVLVTAHANREWAGSNNDVLRATASKYPNAFIADWDGAIKPHPEFLAADGTHPDSDGARIYAECVAAAIASIR